MARFYCPAPLQTGLAFDLPANAARHVQVLRMQPGDSVTLFNSGNDDKGAMLYVDAGEYEATITHMGRSSVSVLVVAYQKPEREKKGSIHLAVGVPANDRMDWLVEKATELGVVSIQPLITERSVLRLSGDRAEKKVAHWQSVAVAACEQCGGNRVPQVYGMMNYTAWMYKNDATIATKAVLSLHSNAKNFRVWKESLDKTSIDEAFNVMTLSGPEGGLSPQEEEVAIQQGFTALSLGDRVLRAETAAITVVAGLIL